MSDAEADTGADVTTTPQNPEEPSEVEPDGASHDQDSEPASEPVAE